MAKPARDRHPNAAAACAQSDTGRGRVRPGDAFFVRHHSLRLVAPEEFGSVPEIMLIDSFRAGSGAGMSGLHDGLREGRAFPMKIGRTCVALAFATACLSGFAPVSAQEGKSAPLVTQGIGASNCAKLVADLKPAEGLNNPVNLMLYSWAQGYVSAANVSLLEASGKHVDINTLDEAKVLNGVLDYCKANPTGRPVSALDELIRKATKLKAKWDAGTISWDG